MPYRFGVLNLEAALVPKKAMIVYFESFQGLRTVTHDPKKSYRFAVLNLETALDPKKTMKVYFEKALKL